MELQKGRPENTDGRLDKEIRVYDFLDKLGIQYQRIDHEAAMTMEAMKRLIVPLVTTPRSAKICFCAIARRRISIFF